jgi:hypothetical protein
MADEKDGSSSALIPTLLGSLPSTDLQILKAIADARLSNIHFAVIGRIAALWSYLESVIDRWLWTFAEIQPEIGVCFTAQMIGPRPRIDAFIALVRQLGAAKSWNDILEKFAKDAQGLAEQRNRAIHDVWQMDDPTCPQRLEATAKRAARLLKVHVPTKELIALADKIDALRARFDDDIANKSFNELHASPDKSELTPPP